MIHSRIMAKKQEVASAERLAAEGGFASDESAVVEPEIDWIESSEEIPEIEPDDDVEWEGEYCEAGCPIEMGRWSGWKCGRMLHAAPAGADEQPVCLMHSKDPNKQSGPLFDAFWLEFERILEGAGDNEARFEGFIFSRTNLIGREFKAICRFDDATFTQKASFFGATFKQKAVFWGATFTQNANFSNATFMQDAIFDGATFMQDAGFLLAAFRQDAYFGHATFTQDASFLNANFTQRVGFTDATFTRKADFTLATFTQDAYFRSATFKQGSNFSPATFTQKADFEQTKFYGTANWASNKFHDQAEFRHTVFEPRNPGTPSAVFSLTKFAKPGEVVFDDVDLSRTLFHNCDISQVLFTPSVHWARRPPKRGLAVFEETIPLDHEDAKGLFRGGQRDYRAIAQIYQQLKKSYDSRLDYWTANEFHFGEMEMKRLAGPTKGWFLRLRQWWHRNLSFVAWYKYASDYGNSYRKPVLWLLGTLLAAALLFPLPGVGLRPPISGDAASAASVTYIRVWNRQDSWTNNFWTEAKLIGKSGITAIDMATFQKTPEYTPVYPWGRVLAIVETLLTSSLFALFLLAIRRQFRR